MLQKKSFIIDIRKIEGNNSIFKDNNTNINSIL